MSGWDDLYGADGEAEAGGDVAAIVEEQRKTADLTRSQRKQRARDARRSKVSLDFSAAPEIEDLLREVCELEGTGISSTAMYLLALGLRAYQEGARPRKQPARSLKFSWDCVIEIEGLGDF
jgi:hypothetical protein